VPHRLARAVWITDDRHYDLRHPRCCAKTAARCGSVPEIIDPGVTGHTLSTMDEAIRMLPQVLALDCRTVRQRFEQRFSGGLHRQRLPSGHLEKFLSRRRCESDSLNAGWRRSVPRAIGWRRNHPTLADEDLRGRAVTARTASAKLSQMRASRARTGRVADQIDLNQNSTPWC